MPRSKRRGRNAEPGHGILSVPVSLSARISMEGSHASGNLDVHRRPGGRGGRGERRAARSEPRHRAIPEHRPGVGWLWPRHWSRWRGGWVPPHCAPRYGGGYYGGGYYGGGYPYWHRYRHWWGY